MTDGIRSRTPAPDVGELFIAIQHLDALLAVIEECASDSADGRAFLLSQIGQVITTDLLQQFDEGVLHD